MRARGQRTEDRGQKRAVIVGGCSADERPAGWADVFGEWICDLYGVVDPRLDGVPIAD